MSFRPKYSLRLFLIFATAVTLFLGYSHHRRSEILTACNELGDYGYDISAPSQWRDYLWQRKPTVEASFYQDYKQLIQADLKNESADHKPIENFVTVGIDLEKFKQIERRERERHRRWISRMESARVAEIEQQIRMQADTNGKN